MDNLEPKPYSIAWFLQELVKGLFIAIALFMLQIAGTGILQAYLLPDRMDKESAKIEQRIDLEIKAAHDEAIKRESELIQELNQLKKQYADAINQLNAGPAVNLNEDPAARAKRREQFWKKFEDENKDIDPEKMKLKWIQEHSKK